MAALREDFRTSFGMVRELPAGNQASISYSLPLSQRRSSSLASRDDSRIDMTVGRHSFRLVLVSGDLADLPLNCPKCWRPMRDLHVRAADGTIIDVAAATDADVHVYRCAEHGAALVSALRSRVTSSPDLASLRRT